MFAIMAALATTPMLWAPFKHDKNFNHVFTRMLFQTHLEQNSFGGNCTHFHLYAVCRTQPGQKSTQWHTSSRSSAGIYTTMRNNAGRVPSTRINVGRVNKQICNHGGWTTHSNAVLKTTTQFYSSAHQELKIQSIHIKQFWANNVNELHNKTLWRPHRHGSGPKTINLMHPRTPMKESLHDSCKKQRWSCDIKHLRTSLEHVCNHGSANHAHAVPNAIRGKIDSRTHKNQETNTSHIDYRSTRHAHDWTKKNTVAGRTTVVTTLAFPTPAVTWIEPRTHHFGELTDMPISNHWTRRANSLQNQTLRL